MGGDVDHNYDILLGELLVRAGKITPDQLSCFIVITSQKQLRFVELLEDEGVVTHDELIDLYVEYFQIPLIKQDERYSIDDYSRMEFYCKEGYFSCHDEHNHHFVIVNNIYKILELLDLKHPILFAHTKDFYNILEYNFENYNSVKARYQLGFLYPGFTANSIDYKKVIAAFSVFFLYASMFLAKSFFIFNSIIFCLQNVLKIFLCISSKFDKSDIHQYTSVESYPIYTILLPIYLEGKQLPNLVHYISNLIYPKSRLDVKLIVEEDDHDTLSAIEKLNIPNYFHIIKVPYSHPRTKPKALNYAMQYAKGEYVVIYDADDKPDRDQLLKAISMFGDLPAEYVCLQAKLNYYNKDENLLTKLFSMEYSIWFEYLIRGLYILGLPIPLGGTSNHFKAAALKVLGCWDAYNVTEDADLGIRLYSCGYKTALFDSYTLEESPISIKNWMYQRSRWIKGYIQTFIVYIKNIRQSQTKMPLVGHVVAIIFVGCVTYSFFILPWMFFAAVKTESQILSNMLIYNLIIGLCYMYSSAFVVIKNSSKYSKQSIVAFIMWPFYFLLHSIASYKAIYDLITSPFKWNKTTHGISKYIDPL